MRQFGDVYLMQNGAVRALSPFEQHLEALFDEQNDSVRLEPDAYRLVPWVYRCTQLRANVLGGLPVAITRDDGTEVDFPLLTRDIISSIEFALCLYGASYVLKISRGKAITGLQWLNPVTVRVEAGPLGIRQFVQDADGHREFRPEAMIYHRLPNPLDDLGPGVSPARVALHVARLACSANAYASRFFSSGAVPAVILTTDQPIPDAEVERVRSVWDRLFGGVRNAFRTAVLRSGLKPTIIGSQFKDVMMTDVLMAARQQIAVAFGIPQTLIEDAANFATAREHKLNFYYETIFPEADLIAEGLNRQLFAPLGLKFRFCYEAVEAVQQDEATKAMAIVQLAEAGIISVSEAREVLGYETQKYEVEPVSPRAMSDLWRWREKAIRRGEDVDFASEEIPDWLYNAMRARLANMDVRDAFEPVVRAYDRSKADRKLRQRLIEAFDAHINDISSGALSGSLPHKALDALSNELTSVLIATLTAIVQDVVMAEAIEVGVGVDYDDVLSDAAAWAQQYVYDLVSGIRDTEVQHLQNVISQLVDGKLTREDAVAMIEQVFSPVRAEMIATTEVTRALSQANEIYAKQLRNTGHRVQVRWLTAEDERVCVVCGPLDHTLEEAWREQFPSGPPAHVNCRCRTVVEVARA